MIIIFFKGGFGNQIFQAQFVKTILNKNESIITKKEKYFDFFDYSSNWKIIQASFFAAVINRIAFFLAKTKIITFIKPKIINFNSEQIEFEEVEIINGLFPFIRYVSGYFQTDLYSSDLPIPKKSSRLNIKKKIDSKFKNKFTVFVHVRRGDYINFKCFGEKVVLSNEYFLKGIRWFEQNTSDSVFLFFSDNIESVKKDFSQVNNSFFISDSELLDFSLMLSCKGGIISNSTFSWWAGYLLPENSLIIAPKYWLGWKKKIWHPEGINTNKFKYLN